MANLNDVRQKLRFADFLLERGDSYLAAANRHLLDAASILVSMHYDLANTSISPQLVSQKLEQGSKVEKDFAMAFTSLWRTAQTKQNLKDVLLQVKLFLQFVELQHVEQADKQIETSREYY